MNALEKMNQRTTLVPELINLDNRIKWLTSCEWSSDVADAALALLHERTSLCDRLFAVGFQAWEYPLDPMETKVS